MSQFIFAYKWISWVINYFLYRPFVKMCVSFVDIPYLKSYATRIFLNINGLRENYIKSVIVVIFLTKKLFQYFKNKQVRKS